MGKNDLCSVHHFLQPIFFSCVFWRVTDFGVIPNCSYEVIYCMVEMDSYFQPNTYI